MCSGQVKGVEKTMQLDLFVLMSGRLRAVDHDVSSLFPRKEKPRQCYRYPNKDYAC